MPVFIEILGESELPTMDVRRFQGCDLPPVAHAAEVLGQLGPHHPNDLGATLNHTLRGSDDGHLEVLRWGLRGTSTLGMS